MVSKKKYNAVLKDLELYKKWFHCLKNSIAFYKDEIMKLCDSNRELINQVDEYRRKYCDEQHKRLLLAEQVESLEAKVKDAESGGYI